MIFDHIGLVVPDLVTGTAQVEQILPIIGWTDGFDDAALGVSVRFGKDKTGVVFELIAPFGENSPVANILKKRDGTLNQLAYRVENLEQAAQHLRESRAVPISRPTPAKAFNGAQVQFFMTQFNVVIELVEDADFSHSFEYNER